MKLTAEQEAMLAGERGETMAKVLETLVRYGDLYGADEMVSVTSKYNHLVTSFGLKALGPVYELMGKLIDEGAVSQIDVTFRDLWIVRRRIPFSAIQSLELLYPAS